MIRRLLEQAHDLQRPFVIDRGHTWTVGHSLAEIRRLEAGLRARPYKRCLAFLEDGADLVHLAIAAAGAGVELTIANRHSSLSELAESTLTVGAQAIFIHEPLAGLSIPQLRLAELVPGPEVPTEIAVTPTLVILTTGTTGPAKGARYEWDRLLAQIQRRDDHRGSRWLLLYQLNHFAGLQVLAHVLVNDGTLIIPGTRDIAELRRITVEARVSHLSATPTFWRLFCGQAEAPPLAHVRQITLGGEPSTEELLARLRSLFPEATISQVYATTELGSCFSVTDGLPGFPAALLDDRDRSVALQIIDDQLYVRTRNGMREYTAEQGTSSEWVATGDLVERVGDRVQFRGRLSETINVGGVKVSPAEIEAVIVGVPGVMAARVYGRANAVTGALVAAEVMLVPGTDPHTAKKAILDVCRVRLNRYKQPRLIEFVETLATANSKILRRNENRHQ